MGSYRERPARLAGAVVWTRTAAAGETAPPVLPDGCMDLIWVDGTLLVAGPDTAAFRPSTGAGEFVGLRFAPGTAPALLGVPATELRDRRVRLDDLFPAAGVRAVTGLVDDATDRARALEGIALRRAAETGLGDPALGAVVAALRAGGSVEAIAGRAGLSARALHRRSLAAFGYGPKMLARILRLQRALALARAGVPAAETATRCGYADQAHLSRDVRDLAGCTLRSLVRPLRGDVSAKSGSVSTGGLVMLA
ncbi:helix-turn-helix transcriptional regulator [Nocardia thailandica]|uniref:helix-turn-helix transcriptional regulator n=1 Tax=Nocardia thailandica TaxID=257275 RepID=UPI0006937308|nr:helix-turn-helix transcriptional regulator [Nocardia thailandica]